MQGKMKGTGGVMREQVLNAIRELVKAKEIVPLKDLPERLEAYGNWEKEKEDESPILGINA